MPTSMLGPIVCLIALAGVVPAAPDVLEGVDAEGPVVPANRWNFTEIPSDAWAWEDVEGGRRGTARVRAAWAFDEVVPSWIGRAPDGSRIEVKLGVGGEWFSLGVWTQGTGRTSVNGQSTAIARVATDTLLLKNPAEELDVRVEVLGVARLDRFFLSKTLASGGAANPVDESRAAWGRLIDVPQRAQMNYPNGNVLCSPTSVSMMLAHWARVKEIPEWDEDVPGVQAGVFDPGWGGTGNWPFNTAFAATRAGIVSYVTRLRGIGDAEQWIAAGVPLVCSVSYGLLKGKGAPERNDGHLVVLVGFDADGTPVFNDPGRSAVRLRYRRADFEAAWARSGRTVYVLHPTGWRTPVEGPWADGPARRAR